MRHTTTRTPRFDREWKEMLSMLPADRRQIMEDSIRSYQMTGKNPEGLEGAEMMAFLLIKKIVDRRAKQRLARRRKKETSRAAMPDKLTAQEAETCHIESTEPRETLVVSDKGDAPKVKHKFGPLGDVGRLRKKAQAARQTNRAGGSGKTRHHKMPLLPQRIKTT
ncbi:MAG: DUF6291 domain-containing protein [Muribaculum sp.]|nr:DUF6291 domain-containing protein [Muribaculum sp.]